MNRAGLIGVVCGAFFLAAACGSVVTNENDGSPGGIDASIDARPLADCTASSIAIEDMKQCYTEALCRLLVCQGQIEPTESCDESFYDFYRSFGINFEYVLDRLTLAVMVGAVDYDPSALAACLHPADECDGNPPACENVFTGTKNPNETCFDSSECGAGGSCQGINQTQCSTGTCFGPFPLGASCSQGEPCERGLVCSADVTGARFCSSGNAGQNCQGDFECDNGLFCNGSNLCEASRAAGQTCADQGDCAAPLDCVIGICRRPDSNGAPCNSTCIGPFFCNQGACARLPTLGQSCAASNRCIGLELRCLGGVCAQRANLGATCEQSRDCQPGLVCSQSTCAEPLPIGSVCQSDQVCESFACEGVSAQTCIESDLCY